VYADRGATRWYVDDLVTGRVLALGSGSIDGNSNDAVSAGPYVLWYDRAGGHVGQLTD